MICFPSLVSNCLRHFSQAAAAVAAYRLAMRKQRSGMLKEVKDAAEAGAAAGAVAGAKAGAGSGAR